MVKSVVLGAIVGLLAVAMHLLNRHASQRRAQMSAEIRRWEDDGGPAVEP